MARARSAAAAPPSVRATALLLALALGVVYALTSAGGFVSLDGKVMYDTTAAIVDRHTLALPPHHHGMPGVHGGFYSKYGLAQSLAEIPLYVLGQAIAPHVAASLGSTLAIALALLTSSVVTALAALLFFLLAYELTRNPRGAALATLLVGLASPYWPYAKTDFSEPLSTLALTGAVLFLVRARTRPKASSYVVSGLFVALALLTKLTALFALPALGLYAFYVAVDADRARARRLLVGCVIVALALAVAVAFPRLVTQAAAAVAAAALILYALYVGGAAARRRLAAWSIPVAAGLAGVGAYNVARYGRLTDTGYRSIDDLPFRAPLLHGLQGLLVSPGKGLLWYCPLVFLALALWPLLLRRRRAEGLLALGIALPTLVVFGTYPVWWGGHCWGPRYLAPLLPLLLAPLAFLPEALAQGAGGVWRAVARPAAVALIVLSVAVQALGVGVHVERFLGTGFTGVNEQQSLWVVRDSPLLAHAWLLGYDVARTVAPAAAPALLARYPWRHPTGTSLSQRLAINHWDYWWWQVLGRHGLGPLQQGMIALLLLAALSAALWRLRPLYLPSHMPS